MVDNSVFAVWEVIRGSGGEMYGRVWDGCSLVVVGGGRLVNDGCSVHLQSGP